MNSYSESGVLCREGMRVVGALWGTSVQYEFMKNINSCEFMYEFIKYEFIWIWIHILWIHMNSYFMNSYEFMYEFIKHMNSYTNSYEFIWIHIHIHVHIWMGTVGHFSTTWIHEKYEFIWIHVWTWTHMIEFIWIPIPDSYSYSYMNSYEFIYEFMKHMNSYGFSYIHEFMYVWINFETNKFEHQKTSEFNIFSNLSGCWHAKWEQLQLLAISFSLSELLFLSHSSEHPECGWSCLGQGCSQQCWIHLGERPVTTGMKTQRQKLVCSSAGCWGDDLVVAAWFSSRRQLSRPATVQRGAEKILQIDNTADCAGSLDPTCVKCNRRVSVAEHFYDESLFFA